MRLVESFATAPVQPVAAMVATTYPAHATHAAKAEPDRQSRSHHLLDPTLRAVRPASMGSPTAAMIDPTGSPPASLATHPDGRDVLARPWPAAPVFGNNFDTGPLRCIAALLVLDRALFITVPFAIQFPSQDSSFDCRLGRPLRTFDGERSVDGPVLGGAIDLFQPLDFIKFGEIFVDLLQDPDDDAVEPANRLMMLNDIVRQRPGNFFLDPLLAAEFDVIHQPTIPAEIPRSTTSQGCFASFFSHPTCQTFLRTLHGFALKMPQSRLGARIPLALIDDITRREYRFVIMALLVAFHISPPLFDYLDRFLDRVDANLCIVDPILESDLGVLWRLSSCRGAEPGPRRLLFVRGRLGLFSSAPNAPDLGDLAIASSGQPNAIPAIKSTGAANLAELKSDMI